MPLCPFHHGLKQEIVDLHFWASGERIALQPRIRRDDQQRELRRLRDPQGAVPEIHDRLRLVRPNETLIFVFPKPAPVTSTAP